MGGGGTYPLGIGGPEIRVRGGGQNFGLPPRFLFVAASLQKEAGAAMLKSENENSARGKGADCDMLTHEKVLKVFGPYLDADPDYEVVKTSRGYTLLAWNNRREEWFSAEFCKTPEDLRDALLDAYVNYLEYVVTDEDRDPTEQEMREIQKKRQAMYEECMKEGL